MPGQEKNIAKYRKYKKLTKQNIKRDASRGNKSACGPIHTATKTFYLLALLQHKKTLPQAENETTLT